MIYLILCIIISVIILITFKLFERFGVHRGNAIVLSYFVSFALALLTNGTEGLQTLSFTSNWFITGGITGITFYLGFRLFAVSTHKIGLAVTSISSNMSVIVPVIFAIIFYQESTSGWKIPGIILALISFYFVLKPEKNTHLDRHNIYLPILLFVITGTNAILISLSQTAGGSEHMLLLMADIFFFAFAFGMVVNRSNRKKTPFTRRDIEGAAALGLLNYGSTMMILKSLSVLDDTVFFPGYNAGYIVLSAFVGTLIFKERLHTVNKIGIALATIAVIIITSGI